MEKGGGTTYTAVRGECPNILSMIVAIERRRPELKQIHLACVGREGEREEGGRKDEKEGKMQRQ